MNKELQTVVDWDDHYRSEFHLPVAERGGYVGSALMIPTSFDRCTREGAFWVNPPTRDQLLPLLSTVVSTALAETAERGKVIGPIVPR
ncbi:hypothetical protein IU500_01165 [Nocardia terpenica]|uniref:hypothetical protein n=1 Tax=Nocardia terpenica TaxID=455432 RepID=UPI0018946DA1|nr:hypothetical protein [Nocardia terpenica]MBF6059814.1 hypothetical protein [Nocardia terpenica]MBF6102645.1 hypothetical protein [Nocardia terpenica]MBF6111164.1 hypothetical protein [Nocardia terpenica]MBF6117295.1 hypothetical protein [Nocardia terpenica]MBF6150864.1 hypothetical protein [Nocardia terpenica]